jgi:hypothetical protein
MDQSSLHKTDSAFVGGCCLHASDPTRCQLTGVLLGRTTYGRWRGVEQGVTAQAGTSEPVHLCAFPPQFPSATKPCLRPIPHMKTIPGQNTGMREVLCRFSASVRAPRCIRGLGNCRWWWGVAVFSKTYS